MKQGLQKVNHYKQLTEWAQRVEGCRKSGQKVRGWCSEQGIALSTYYSWQRKMYQTATAEPEVCFTEISFRPAGRESGALRIKIHTGADAETVRAISQALKECCQILRERINEDSGFFHAQNHFHAVSLSGGKDNE